MQSAALRDFAPLYVAYGVIRIAPTGSKASPNVRYAFIGDPNLCVPTNQLDVPKHKVAALQPAARGQEPRGR